MNQRIAKAIHELHEALTEHVKNRGPHRGNMDFYEQECMKIYQACSRMIFWAKRNKGD